MCYLKETADLEIVYKKRDIMSYSDSVYTDDCADWCSINEATFLSKEDVFVWYSCKQKMTVMFITETKYMSLFNSEKITVWIQSFLHKLWFHDIINELISIKSNCESKVITLIDDNQSSLTLVKNSEFHIRIKHINVQYHHICELAEDEIIKLKHYNTEDMAADCLTKSLTRSKFKVRVNQLSMK